MWRELAFRVWGLRGVLVGLHRLEFFSSSFLRQWHAHTPPGLKVRRFIHHTGGWEFRV